MRYLRYSLLALAAAARALAQTSVDQILEKYAQALGGQAAYEKVTTRAMKGTVEMPDDNVTGTALVVAKAPDSFRLTMDIPGYGVVETVVDGGNGWEKNPDSGMHAMSKADLAVAQRDHHFYREMRLKELYPKMESARARIRWRGARFTWWKPRPPAVPPRSFTSMPESGLLVKRDFERVTLEDGIVQYEVLLRDYRDVDGLKFPFTIEQRAPDNTMIFKFAEIKNNAAAGGRRPSPNRKNRIHAKIHAPRAGGVSRYGRLRTHPFHRDAALFRIRGNRISALALGYCYRDAPDVGFPRVRVECEYRSAVVFDDLVDIAVSVKRVGTSSYTLEFAALKDGGHGRQWVDRGGVRGTAGAGAGVAGGTEKDSANGGNRQRQSWHERARRLSSEPWFC